MKISFHIKISNSALARVTFSNTAAWKRALSDALLVKFPREAAPWELTVEYQEDRHQLAGWIDRVTVSQGLAIRDYCESGAWLEDALLLYFRQNPTVTAYYTVEEIQDAMHVATGCRYNFRARMVSPNLCRVSSPDAPRSSLEAGVRALCESGRLPATLRLEADAASSLNPLDLKPYDPNQS